MIVDKNKFLHLLEQTKPAVSAKEIIEFSYGFIFYKNKVVTFNDEYAIVHPFKCELQGVVKGQEFFNIISKINPKKEGIEINQEDNQIIIYGKKSKAGLPFTPLEEFPFPKEILKKDLPFKQIPDKFIEGLEKAAICTSKDFSTPILTCVSVHDKIIEASNSYRGIRIYLPNSMEKFLISYQYIPIIAKYKVQSYCLLKNWICFKTEDSTHLFLRIFQNEEFPHTDSLYKQGKVKKIIFSKNITDIIDRAMIFCSNENFLIDLLTIDVNKGVITISANKEQYGWFKETITTKIKEKFSFKINAQFLKDLLIFTKICFYDEEKELISFEGENWKYIASTSK